ncbi:MAG: hypothetical protein M0R03_12445 [Novosphingobium sp.]|nr:hypothetical protein [Novosphingobium sp.]
MAQAIRHASATKPRVYSWDGAVPAQDLDRVQSFGFGNTQPFEMLYEEGRRDKMFVDLDIPETSLSITQLEYDSLNSFLIFANKSSLPAGGLQLSDFSNAYIDLISVGKGEFGGTLEQTLWLPKLSLNSFSIGIADAQARLERTFEFSGDDYRIAKYGNKYVIIKTDTTGSGYSTSSYAIVLSDPAPVENPNTSGAYLYLVTRKRAGVITELVSGTDYSYNHYNNTLTIVSATTDDIYQAYYTAASWPVAGDPTSVNNVDSYRIKADSVTITLESADQAVVTTLDKLTGLNIAATLNRISEAVIGKKAKELNEVENYQVNLTLDGRVKNSTIEEVLMGKSGLSWPVIDVDHFATDLVFRMKVYDSPEKTTFLHGVKITGLFYSDASRDVNANEFWSKGITLQSDNVLISDVEANIDA